MKRRIVDEARVWGDGCVSVMCAHLAEVYSDHPDYDEAWRP